MQLCKIVVTRRLSDGCAKGLGNTPREVASVAADSGQKSWKRTFVEMISQSQIFLLEVPTSTFTFKNHLRRHFAIWALTHSKKTLISYTSAHIRTG